MFLDQQSDSSSSQNLKWACLLTLHISQDFGFVCLFICFTSNSAREQPLKLLPPVLIGHSVEIQQMHASREIALYTS